MVVGGMASDLVYVAAVEFPVHIQARVVQVSVSCYGAVVELEREDMKDLGNLDIVEVLLVGHPCNQGAVERNRLVLMEGEGHTEPRVCLSKGGEGDDVVVVVFRGALRVLVLGAVHFEHWV
jgi:hypothetical protein